MINLGNKAKFLNLQNGVHLKSRPGKYKDERKRYVQCMFA